MGTARRILKDRRLDWRLRLLVLVALLIAYRFYQAPEAPRRIEGEGTYSVERVIDGDTFVLEGGERVRLIGVNTPELARGRQSAEPLAEEARQFTRRQIENQEVLLQFDRERRDRYGRLLAYVYREEWMLNEELIRAGYSRAETKYSYSPAMKRRFQHAEEEARQARRGLWKLRKLTTR